MLKQKIDNFIEGKLEEMLDEIVHLVSFPSVTGNKAENRACLEYFLKLAENLGFRTLTTTDWDVGIVEMGEGDETLGILVHVDVVGIGDREKWTNDPFQAVNKDGFLWGRGTEDDKGAVIMSLYAMKAVQRLGLPMHRKVWLIVGTSEEAKWTDIASFKKQYPVPWCGFSPDGRFPIFNKEKGYADLVLEFYRDGKRGIQKLRGGDSPNSIPSKARIVLQNGRTVVVHGKSTHSSIPENGVNAIIKLCNRLNTIEVTDFDFVRFIEHFLENDGQKKGFIDDGSDELDGEYIGMTTLSPTMISLTENCVRLTINIRHKYGTTREDILNAFSTHANEYGYEFALEDYLEPMWVSKDLPFLKTLQEVSQEYGVNSELKFAPGTSYAKSMKNFVSWGPVFPNESATAHTEDERISIDTVLLATKLYARLICRMTVEDL